MQQPSLQSVISSAIDYRLDDVYTSIPCVVVRVVDLAKGRIDVQPSIKQLFKDGTSLDRAPILNVPVQWPSSKTSSITFPINVGDTVMCLFSMRGLDSFKRSNGHPTTPTDLRTFSTRDAVALPGLSPFDKSPNSQANRTLPHNVNDMVVTHNLGEGAEVEIRLKEDGSIAINAQSKNVSIKCNTLAVDGNITATGTIIDSGGNTNHHSH